MKKSIFLILLLLCSLIVMSVGLFALPDELNSRKDVPCEEDSSVELKVLVCKSHCNSEYLRAEHMCAFLNVGCLGNCRKIDSFDRAACNRLPKSEQKSCQSKCDRVYGFCSDSCQDLLMTCHKDNVAEHDYCYESCEKEVKVAAIELCECERSAHGSNSKCFERCPDSSTEKGRICWSECEASLRKSLDDCEKAFDEMSQELQPEMSNSDQDVVSSTATKSISLE